MSVNIHRRRSGRTPDHDSRETKQSTNLEPSEASESENNDRNSILQNSHEPVLEAATDPEVVEVLSDEDDDVAARPALSDHEDIEITGVNLVEQARNPTRIRHRRIRPHARNVRLRRDHDTTDDIQIVDERPVLPLARFDDTEEFRRALMGRFGTLESPIGTFEGDFGRVVSVITGMNRWRRVPGSAPQGSVDPRTGSRRHLRRRRPVRYASEEQYEQHEFPFLFEGAGTDASAMERSIMERIDRENDRDLDGKLRQENKYNTKQLQAKQAIAAHEQHGYTNDISPQTPFTCELCAVPLGTGIPAEFTPNAKYDANLERYSRLYRVQAPWFCSRQISPVDIDLSKRVFVAKCGHLYCGRCIKNIGNRPRHKRASKQLTIENPGLSCPRRCPAAGCNVEFRGKRTFTELYF